MPHVSAPAKTARYAAAEHFRKLTAMLLETAVTDRAGVGLSLDEGIEKAAELIHAVGTAGRKIMLVGNGGSAAIVSHMQNDLCKAVGVRAIVFNEPPLLTALTNDHGYEVAFERPVALWADAGDLIIAVSSSGKSENILRAVQAAVTRGCGAVTFSGFRADNPLRCTGEVNFYVPAQTYGCVESAHSALTHFLTDCAMASRPRDPSTDATASGHGLHTQAHQ